MTDEEKAELERRIASQRGTIRVYNDKLKSRLEQVERLKQENAELKDKLEKLKANEWHYERRNYAGRKSMGASI